MGGWLLFKQKYTTKQVICICVITVGIFLGSIGDASLFWGGTCVDCSPGVAASAKATSGGGSNAALVLWSCGIAILVACQVLQAVLGHFQAMFYKEFADKAPKGMLADEYLFTSHVCSLVMILVLWRDILEAGKNAIATDPIAPYLPIPRAVFFIFLNNVCQTICIKGVFRLSAFYAPLTVNVTLSVRKFLSVIVSILWFGNPWTMLHSVATLAIFGGAFAYSQCGAAGPPAATKKKE